MTEKTLCNGSVTRYTLEGMLDDEHWECVISASDDEIIVNFIAGDEENFFARYELNELDDIYDWITNIPEKYAEVLEIIGEETEVHIPTA